MKSRMFTLVALFAIVMGLLTACGGSSSTTTTTAGGKTIINLWTHSAGNATEIGALKKNVATFNASQSQYEVNIQSFPQASYNDSVSAAALAHKLPCIIDMDNPTVANFAWDAGDEWSVVGEHPRAVLLVWGSADTVTPYRNAEKVMRLYPRATLLTAPPIFMQVSVPGM